MKGYTIKNHKLLRYAKKICNVIAREKINIINRDPKGKH